MMSPKLPFLILLAFAGCGPAPEPPPPASTPKPKPPTLIFGTLNEDAAKLYPTLTWEKDATSRMREGSATDQMIKEHDRALSILNRAARANRCAWKPERIDAFAPKADAVSIINAGRLLGTLVLLRMEQGRKLEAIEALIVGLKIGTDHLDDPRLFVKLIGSAVILITTEAIRMPLALNSFNALELAFLEQHLAVLAGRVPGIEKVLLDEAVCFEASIEPFLNLGFLKAIERLSGVPSGSDPQFLGKLDNILMRDRAASREEIQRRFKSVLSMMLEDVRRPLNSKESRFSMENFRDQCQERGEEWAVSPSPDSAAGISLASDMFICMLAPPHLKLRENLALARLQIEALLLWARLQKSGLEKRTFPESLRGLLQVPQDPFDGEAIKYAKWTRGQRSVFILTATGPENDWEKRSKFLAERCDFDLRTYVTQFEEYEKALIYTWVGHLPAPSIHK